MGGAVLFLHYFYPNVHKNQIKIIQKVRGKGDKHSSAPLPPSLSHRPTVTLLPMYLSHANEYLGRI